MLTQFLPRRSDTWQWRFAQPADLVHLVALTHHNYFSEVDQIYDVDIMLGTKNLHRAIVEQIYDSNQVLILVAEDKSGIIAWTWVRRGVHQVWSSEESAEVILTHFAASVPAATRVRLLAQCIQQWAVWCQTQGIPVLVSNTIRQDQAGFLRIHEQAGFVIRGSFALLRLLEKTRVEH